MSELNEIEERAAWKKELEGKDEEIIYLNSKFYFEKKIPIHLTYKNGTWNNGIIKELGTYYLLLEDFEDGLLAPIFFVTVKKIAQYGDLGKKHSLPKVEEETG